MLALSHFRAALRKMNVISIDLPLGQNISMCASFLSDFKAEETEMDVFPKWKSSRTRAFF